MTLLDAALAYAARGWPVLPCKPGSKEPDTLHGLNDATIDPAEIRAWWAEHPDDNVGIATGGTAPDVLDIDVKAGDGYGTFADLASAGLADGASAYVRTPSGGLHAYYAGTGQRNGSIRGRSLDFRGAGGYVLAPPSVVGGKRYALISEQSHATQPVDWTAIRAYLTPPDPPFQQPGNSSISDPASGKGSSSDRPGDAWAAVTSWVDILTPHGWRQVRRIGNVRYWCRPGKTGPFTSATTRDGGGLWAFSTSTSFEAERLYTKFGAYAVLAGFGHDYAAAAAQLRADGYGTPSAPALAAAPTIPVAFQQPARGLPVVDLADIAARGITKPGRIAGGMLYPASVHCVAGQPGGGKTTIIAWWMLSHIREGGLVMFLDEESGPEQAAEKFLDLGATIDELRSLTYVPFPARGWNADDLAQLHALITELQPGIIAWDSVAAFLAVAGKDENSAAEVTAFWQRVLVPCARQFGAAVVAADHTGKGDHGGYGRGSGAKKAASDVQYIVETIKPFSRQQDGLLRLTTSPGKDRRGWLAMAYDIRVRTGRTLTLEITAADDGAQPPADEPPAKVKLWAALTALGSEQEPVTARALVDWIVENHGHGLTRPTYSKHLNALLSEGRAGMVDLGQGRDKLWFPSPSATGYLSPRNQGEDHSEAGTVRPENRRSGTRKPVNDASHLTPLSASPPSIRGDDGDTPLRVAASCPGCFAPVVVGEPHECAAAAS